MSNIPEKQRWSPWQRPLNQTWHWSVSLNLQAEPEAEAVRQPEATEAVPETSPEAVISPAEEGSPTAVPSFQLQEHEEPKENRTESEAASTQDIPAPEQEKDSLRELQERTIRLQVSSFVICRTNYWKSWRTSPRP